MLLFKLQFCIASDKQKEVVDFCSNVKKFKKLNSCSRNSNSAFHVTP